MLATLEKKFVPKLQSLARKALGKKKAEKTLKSAANAAAIPEIGKSVCVVQEAPSRPEGEREGGDDDDDDDGDDDATNEKQKSNRGQAISYAENDEDDDVVQAQMEKEVSPEDEDEGMEDEGIGGSIRDSASDDDDENDDGDKSQKRQIKDFADEREAQIMKKNTDVTRFGFDDQAGSWCEIALEYAADAPKVLMLNVLETALRTSLVQQIPGLDTCTYELEEVEDGKTGEKKTAAVIHTAGVNLKAMQAYSDYINPNKISTNDIAAMLSHYGVEACRSTIIQELSGVFGSHGISVDNRHLNLIADYMTRGGGFSPFNRNGLKSSVSPFLKMSFETTIGFLRDAVMDGDWDDLRSPSSRIVIGRTSKVGTGSFDVLTKVPVPSMISTVASA